MQDDLPVELGAPVFQIPPTNVYHQIKTPLQASSAAAKDPKLNSTPSTTPPPNTPLHPFYAPSSSSSDVSSPAPAGHRLSSSSNPIPAAERRSKRGVVRGSFALRCLLCPGPTRGPLQMRDSSMDNVVSVFEGEKMFGTTAATKNSTCFVCKQKLNGGMHQETFLPFLPFPSPPLPPPSSSLCC